MSTAEQQQHLGHRRRRRPQPLSRRGSRDGRRHRQHRRRKRHGRRQAAGAGRGHHHRLLDLDAVAAEQVRRSEAGHQGSGRRNGRRHLLHDHRRYREGRGRLPGGRTTDAGERSDQGGGRARRRQPATQRRDSDRHLARARPEDRRTASGSARPTRSCSPTARTSTRPPRNSARRSASAKANSPVTAGEWAPTGASRSCGRSRPHCWAPSTSSPTRQISPTTSRR